MFAAARLFAYQNKTLKHWHKPQKRLQEVATSRE